MAHLHSSHLEDFDPIHASHEHPFSEYGHHFSTCVWNIMQVKDNEAEKQLLNERMAGSLHLYLCVFYKEKAFFLLLIFNPQVLKESQPL